MGENQSSGRDSVPNIDLKLFRRANGGEKVPLNI